MESNQQITAEVLFTRNESLSGPALKSQYAE